MVTLADRCRPPLVAVTLALAATALAPPAAPAVTLDSESDWQLFGAQFAIDGTTIATIDRTRECLDGPDSPGCAFQLRIGTLTGDRVHQVAAFPLADVGALPSVAMRGSTVVVRNLGTLTFFVEQRGMWGRANSVELERSCIQRHFTWIDVHLGDDVLVVESEEVWCIYERTPRGWSLATQLPHPYGTEIGVSGKRVVELHTTKGVAIYERRGRVWERTRTIPSPRGVRFGRAAVSTRWLAARGKDDFGTRRIHVFDLDEGRHVSALDSEFADDLYAKLGIGATTLVTTGARDEVWRLVDGAWRPDGLIDHVHNERGDRRPVGIGERVWIGEPTIYTVDPGVVRAFRIH